MAKRPPSERVVQTVAETNASDPLDMPPLFEYVDSDALDALVRGLERGSVTFDYAGRSVTVDSDGSITVDQVQSDATGETAVVEGMSEA